MRRTRTVKTCKIGFWEFGIRDIVIIFYNIKLFEPGAAGILMVNSKNENLYSLRLISLNSKLD